MQTSSNEEESCTSDREVPGSAQDAVLVKSEFDKDSATPVKGYEHNYL